MTDKTTIGLDQDVLRSLCEKASREQIWATFLEHISARRVAEIGVWKGEFALHLLSSCQYIEQYYMIDPWRNLQTWDKPFNVSQEEFDQIYKTAMNNTQNYSTKRTVLAQETKNAVANIDKRSLDFAYIDGDHTLRGIVLDLFCILSRVRHGGFVGGDDFSADPWQHGTEYEPTLVCPFAVYFCEAVDLPIITLPHNQFLIHNNPEAGFSFTDQTGNYGDLSLKPGQQTSKKKSVLDRILSLRKG